MYTYKQQANFSFEQFKRINILEEDTIYFSSKPLLSVYHI